MSDSLQHRSTRAPRVALRGTTTVLIQLENLRRIPAKLQQLSITGGLLELAKYVDERVKVDMTLPVGSSILRPKAQMLFPMRGARGYLQPFRLINVSAEELQILEREINSLLKQTLAQTIGSHGLGFRPPRFYLE